MMSLWDALRMNMMISYQELVRTFPKCVPISSLWLRCISYKQGTKYAVNHGAASLGGYTLTDVLTR